MVENELGEGADDGFAGVVVLCYSGTERVVEKGLGRVLDYLNKILVVLCGCRFCCRHCCCDMREHTLDMYDECVFSFLDPCSEFLPPPFSPPL